MEGVERMQYAFLPVFLFVVCVIGLAVGLLIVGYLFNPSRSGRVARMPYESGMDPIHDTRRRFDVRFHMLAIAFLVFDVELLFLYPWAVAAQPAQEQQGIGDWGPGISERHAARNAGDAPRPAPNPQSPIPLQGIDAAVAGGLVESRHLVFAGAMTFVALLMLGFVYDWRKEVFRWRQPAAYAGDFLKWR
jgi:NADH-quinone oxidoreductase subunit A